MQTAYANSASEDPHRDLLDWRSQFPILQKKLFMNTCSLGALSERSIAGMQEFLTLWSELGASAWYEIWVGKLAELRAAYGRVVGSPPARIALMPNISTAISSVVSALDFSKRNKVVVTSLDFPTVGHHFLARGAQGLELVVIESPDGVTVPLDLFEDAIDEGTALVVTSHVYFTTGAIQDVKAIAGMAHAKGALFLVDAYQGTGHIPTDVIDMGVDFYVSGSLKWLLGGPGIAFLYVAEHLAGLAPTAAGWWGMTNMFEFDLSAIQWRDEASRYEMGTPATAAVYAALGGLSIIEEIGVEKIRERDIALTEDLISRALNAGFSPRIAPTAEQRTPIVLLNFRDPKSIVAALAARGAIVDHRPGVVRVSPYFYNSIDENDAIIEAIREVAGK